MLPANINIPPLFTIDREEIAPPTIQQVEQVVQKQQVEYKEIEVNPPNRTLYVNRLNEKVQVEEMRQTLYALFSQAGTVLDIIFKRNLLMRGQAFIIMHDEQSAIKAQEQFQNSTLYEKVMKVNFAKEKSYFVAKAEGTFVEKEKLPMSDRIKEHKRKIQERRYKEQFNQKSQKEVPTISMPLGTQSQFPNQQKQKVNQMFNQQSGNQPNKVLFVEGLQVVDFTNLEQHFRNFYGFKEFRGIKLKGVAFVEFEDELKATHCLNELNGTEFEGIILQISYQKK